MKILKPFKYIIALYKKHLELQDLIYMIVFVILTGLWMLKCYHVI